MAQEIEETQHRLVLPYIAFRTLQDLLKRMDEEEPPARIDKSYLHTFSGGYQTQVIASLNALGLRDGVTGEVTDLLKSLVSADDSGRKTILGDVIREHYSPLLELGTNATQGQMLDAFKGMGVNAGDTMRKVVAFFLAATKYAGVPVSRHWKTPGVVRSGKRTGSKGSGTGTGYPSEKGPETPSARGGGGTQQANLRSVELRSGGTVTLGLTVDLFALDSTDQEFVLDLVKRVRDYGEKFALLAGPQVTDLEGPNANEAGRTSEEDSQEEIEVEVDA